LLAHQKFINADSQIEIILRWWNNKRTKSRSSNQSAIRMWWMWQKQRNSENRWDLQMLLQCTNRNGCKET